MEDVTYRYFFLFFSFFLLEAFDLEERFISFFFSFDYLI